jgi:hypothetical protein
MMREHHQVLDHPRVPRRMGMHMMAWFVWWEGNETLSTLAVVLREVSVAKTVKSNLPDGLFEDVDNLPGFEIHHKSKYYAYVVANPHIARAFIVIEPPQKWRVCLPRSYRGILDEVRICKHNT